MNFPRAQPVKIALGNGREVSALLEVPSAARVCVILAHGAGAGMTHPFMSDIANGLAERDVATLRFQFLYMEQGARRPDPPTLAHLAIRSAVSTASQLLPGLPLFAGGKSFGARMTSQAQAASSLPGVHGLLFLGFPLHPAGKPSDERAAHLFNVGIPMLFIQGTRDRLASLDLLRPLVQRLGAGSTLQLFSDADHSFHVPVGSGRTDSEIIAEISESAAQWIRSVLAAAESRPVEIAEGSPHPL